MRGITAGTGCMRSAKTTSALVRLLFACPLRVRETAVALARPCFRPADFLFERLSSWPLVGACCVMARSDCDSSLGMITRSDVRCGGEAEESEEGDDEQGDANVVEADDGDECAPIGQHVLSKRPLLASEAGKDECGSHRLSECD